MKRLPLFNPTKEAIDHLPSGLCFFDGRGMLVLCNARMHELVFTLTGSDLQVMSDLNEALAKPPAVSSVTRVGDAICLPDGTVWQFSVRPVADEEGNLYTEYSAIDVTALHEEQKKLQARSAEQKQLAEHTKNIVDNVAAIAREEEILHMKALIHNKMGWCLQVLRHYHAAGCPSQEKEAIGAQVDSVILSLRGEIVHDDAPDLLAELIHAAALLGVDIVMRGEVTPGKQYEILTVAAVRECVTNTVRHAQGDKVFVEIDTSGKHICVRITNNGNQPTKPLVEGGGFTSLRQRIQKAGGTMNIESLPQFMLTITFLQGERCD